MSTRRFYDSWWVDFRMNHTRYRIRSPENSQAGAKTYEAVLRKRLAAGEPLNPAPPPPPAPTFAEFSCQWFETYVKTNNKPSVQDSEARALRIHLAPFFGRFRIDKIESFHIEQYKAKKLAVGLKAKTINNHLGILMKCLTSAVEWNRCAKIPRAKRLRTPPPPFKFLTREEIERLLMAWKSPEWRTMALLALHTGLRLGELFGLRWQDVDFANRQLTVRQSIVSGVVGVPKNYRERTIPLTNDVVVALSALPRRGDLVLTRKNGEALSRGMAQNAIKHACRRAGIRQIGWHALRHTFASHLAAASTPITSVQALLGHSSITMTMRYTHVLPSALRDAVRIFETCKTVPAEGAWAMGGQAEHLQGKIEAPTDVRNSAFLGLLQTKTPRLAGCS